MHCSLCCNPLTLSQPKAIVFWLSCLQIVFLSLMALHYSLTYINFFKHFGLPMVYFLIAGLFVSGMILGVICSIITIIGMFLDRPRLVMVNLMYTTAVMVPAFYYLLFSIGHELGTLLVIIYFLYIVSLFVTLIFGTKAYYEAKEINKERLRQEKNDNLALEL